jgi:hypothetical protein
LIVGRLEEFAQQVQQGLEAADLLTRRAILQSVVKRVEVGREQVTVVFRVAAGPFDLRPSRGGLTAYAHYGERVDRCGFHHHRVNATLLEPVGKPVEIGREGAKLADTHHIAAFGHGDKVGRATNVDGGGIEIEVLQMGRQGRGLRGATGGWRTAGHRSMLQVETASDQAEAGRTITTILLSGIARRHH